MVLVGTTTATEADYYLIMALSTDFLAEPLCPKLQVLKDKYLQGKAEMKSDMHENGSSMQSRTILVIDGTESRPE
jgi:hypothetical protein